MKKEKSKYPREVLEAVRTILPYMAGGQLIPLDIILEAQAIKKIPAATLMKIWNTHADRKYFKPCLLLSPKRRRICNARLKEVPDLKKWEAFMKMINTDGWCNGTTPSKNYPNYKVN